MLSARLGHILDKPLASLAGKIDIDPNIVTLAGFGVTVVAAVSLTFNLFIGGILLLIGGILDLLDGVIARVNNRATKFGAFLDSVLDRYSDAFLLLGVSLYYLRNNSITGLILSLLTMIGALIISYAKARAEGLGEKCDAGIMERPERIILLAFGALTGWLFPVMWVMAILTHVTVIQRVFHVSKVMK